MADEEVWFPGGLRTKTDSRGWFDFPPERKSDPQVMGFLRVEKRHHTGGSPGLTYVYCPVGGMSIRCVDSDRRQFSIPVQFQSRTTSYTLRPRMVVGRLVVHDVALGIPTDALRFKVSKPGWRLIGVERQGDRLAVRLTAVFGRQPNAKPTWQSYDGSTVRSW